MNDETAPLLIPAAAPAAAEPPPLMERIEHAISEVVHPSAPPAPAVSESLPVMMPAALEAPRGPHTEALHRERGTPAGEAIAAASAAVDAASHALRVAAKAERDEAQGRGGLG